MQTEFSKQRQSKNEQVSAGNVNKRRSTGRCKATTGKSGINPKPTTEASYLTFKSTLKCIQDTVRSEKE